jgi:F0F1-type ATP synthase membrane subunit b/b'
LIEAKLEECEERVNGQMENLQQTTRADIKHLEIEMRNGLNDQIAQFKAYISQQLSESNNLVMQIKQDLSQQVTNVKL